MSTAIAHKLDRLREQMVHRRLDALALQRLENIFWLAGGLDAHVGLASDLGIATLLVAPHGAWLVTTNIEAPRLLAEEVGDLPFEVVAVPWHEGSLGDRVRKLIGAQANLACDMAGPGQTTFDLAPLRARLDDDEIATYRALGADQGAAVAEAALATRPGDSEFVCAGRLAQAMLARGITPTVILVAADERIAQFRHPIPTDLTVERAAMLVGGGRRRGLIVSVSRLVHFGPLPADLRRRHDAVTAVDATFIAATRPGASVAQIFAAGQAAYAAAGFPDEWRFHHQGGATGYTGRDYRATPSSPHVVAPNQAFAWNPSIAGTKSEDTILALAAGPEILSASPDWPLVEHTVDGLTLGRPDLVVL
ncbi:MAG TPA: hypothetical protein DCZ72_08980 [Armatimonadetes bacterium]|nr:hypothetical protein [Armatimonadota bacterium]